jgi:hypothetical protein
MDPKILESEKQEIEKWFKDEPNYDLCQLDLTELNDPWCNKETLDIASRAFHYQNWIDEVPVLKKNITRNQQIINDRITVIELHGVKYLLKREEYSKSSDTSIHEFFVGLQLNQLRDECPCFAGMIATFGCLPKDGQVCQSYGDKNFSHILYQYIPGKSLWSLYNDKDLDVYELYRLVMMSYFACEFAYTKINFIHQDLHLSNIICRPLDKFYEIKFGKYSFIVRYLPTIIDFARSQVLDKKHSPKIAFLHIPAEDNYFDLNFILNYFSKSIKDNVLSSSLLTQAVDDVKILKVFKEYRIKYSKEYLAEGVLTVSENIVTVKFDTCDVLEKVDDAEAIKYIHMMKRKEVLIDMIIDLNIDKDLFIEYLDILLAYKDEISMQDLNYLGIRFLPQNLQSLINYALFKFNDTKSDIFKPYYKNIIYITLSTYPKIGPKLDKIYNAVKDKKDFDINYYENIFKFYG